jgi:anaerobic selenocysteine-containing dehydrogenase
VLPLVTLRSNGQFNATVYSYEDRFRGVKGTRMVVFMNAADMARYGLAKDDMVDLTTAMESDISRVVRGFRVVPYNIPEGCIGAYFPEANELVPLSHHDKKAQTPAYKAIPVRVTPSAPTQPDVVTA